MSKEQLLKEIITILDTGNRSSIEVGERLSSILNKMSYYGASVSEPRGISNAGVPDFLLTQFLAFNISAKLFNIIADYLMDPK